MTERTPLPAEELVDIVDEDDRVVRTARRDEVRARNELHRCVWIVVLDDAGRLLVHRRTPTKDLFPRYWDLTVGGVVAAGEGYDRAAVRELFEEAGVSGDTLMELGFVRYADAHTRALGSVYLARCDGSVTLQASEVEYAAWLPCSLAADYVRRLPFCPDGLVALLEAQESPALMADGTLRNEALRVACRAALPCAVDPAESGRDQA